MSAGGTADAGEVVDLAVVGGGLCGLAAAWRARLSGRRVVLLEAAPRVGGVLRTRSEGGYRFEEAAAGFPSSAAHLLALRASLPAPPAIVRPPPEASRQYLLVRRGLVSVPRSPAALVRSGLLSLPALLRLLSEAARGSRRSRRPETLAAFVTRRFGRAVAADLLRPVTLGIHGSPPASLGAADAFPTLVETERSRGSLIRALARRQGPRREVWTFEEGMEALPRALAAALGDAVRTATAATAIEPRTDGARVHAASGPSLVAREVVLATTADAQAALLAPLSRVAAEALAAVGYVPMAVVNLGVPPGGSPPIPAAFGFLRGRGARVRVLGCAFPGVLDPSVAPPGHALVRCFLGGAADPDALSLDDGRLREIAERDLGTALGGRVRSDFARVVRHARAIPVLSPGHRARMAAAASLLAPHGVRLSGSHVTGVGVDACCAPLPFEAVRS
jgi:oxygen-dependent protoporphyrinogen oxidase